MAFSRLLCSLAFPDTVPGTVAGVEPGSQAHTVIVSEACGETANDIAESHKAIAWMSAWYEARSALKTPAGQPYLTEAEHRLIQDRLRQTRVIFSTEPFVDLYREVLAGNLHLRTPLRPDYVLDNREVKRLRRASRDLLGFYSPLLREPNVFINPKELLHANLHWEENRGETLYGSMGKAMVHELTHALTAGMRQDLVARQALSALTRQWDDGSYDRPNEIYARIMELRYSAGADPGHLFTLKEVRALRARAEQDAKAFKQEVKGLGRSRVKTLRELPFKGRILDHHLFIRYSDEEILKLLNDLADSPVGNRFLDCGC